MAGNYADPPSYRLPYDRDGSKLCRLATDYSSIITEHSAATMASLNGESFPAVDGSGSGNVVYAWGVMFPEPTDLDGVYVALGYNGYDPNVSTPQVSADTTNLIDGTWTGVTLSDSTVSKVGARNEIRSMTSLGIRALRFKTTGSYYNALRALHLYGEPTVVGGDRLLLWDQTLNQRVSPTLFEWGDKPRGSVTDRTFRVKNMSTTLRATSVRVAMEVLTDANPSVPGQHQLSLDGTTWLAQVNVGNLEPGAISAPVTLRYSPSLTAALSLWTMRVFAEPTTWEVA